MKQLNLSLKGIVLTSLLLLLIFALPVLAANSADSTSDNMARLYGDNRYQTTKVIAEQFNSGTVDTVVLVPVTALQMPYLQVYLPINTMHFVTRQ